MADGSKTATNCSVTRVFRLIPKVFSLYRELARIFQHKIGSVSDDAHEYYKLQLALAMEPLVAPGDEEHFKSLAAAPVLWQQIIRDADVAAFVKSLKDCGQNICR